MNNHPVKASCKTQSHKTHVLVHCSVMLINGFMLREAWYEFYANHLASHGYVVVQYWPQLFTKTLLKTLSGNTDKEVGHTSCVF